MPTLVTLIVLGVVAVLGYGVYRQFSDSGNGQQQISSEGAGEALPDPSSMEPTVHDLDLNDIVSFLGTDYMVEGEVKYNQEGYTWKEYMLVDGEDIRWLCVEQDDQLEVSFWEQIKDLQVMPPVEENLEYEGTMYRMFERGQARAEQRGETGRKQKHKVKFWEFEGNDGEYLAVEKWGSEIEVSKGRDIEPDMLDILPGDGI